MSGASINKKLQKANAKIGQKLGYKFKLYRSVDYLDPVQLKNYLGEQVLSWSIDASFKKPVNENYQQVNLFLDTANLQLGDIFVSEELNKRFVLINKDPLVTPQAIEATNTVSISRTEYSTVGGYHPELVEIAKNIPAAIFEVGGQSQPSAENTGSNKSSISKYALWIWLPVNNIKLDDVLVDNFGNKSRITSIEYSPVGYKLSAVKVKE